MSVRYLEFHGSSGYDDAVQRAAAENRIDREYYDIFGKRHDVSLDTQKRILAALGWDLSSAYAIDEQRQLKFRREWGDPLPVTSVIGLSDRAVTLTLPDWSRGSLCYDIALENGDQLSGAIDSSQLTSIGQVVIAQDRWIRYRLPVPAELPLGYHRLRITYEGREIGKTHLILCPDRAYLPESLQQGGRAAGFNIALYGLRSSRNWGCGDFTDLKTVIDWIVDETAFSFIGLNPLHALHNRAPYNTSPYLPLSLYYKNLIYADIESVPEFSSSRCAQTLFHSRRVQERLRALRDAEFVAYQDVDRIKRRFLKLLYREYRRGRLIASRRRDEFKAFCEREGDLLDKFALYCALDEILHKRDRSLWTWRQWPVEHQSPDSPACQEFARHHAATIEFYKYIQFVLEEQLTAVQSYAKDRGLPIGLYHDLALATDSCGADLWAHREYYVDGCRVGAPPDDFSPSGQDWGFPPPNSDVHRASGYRLYRESIRKIVAHGGALRIDHVMRLFRLFCIPNNASAAQGTYVRDFAEDLMRVLALESVRSGNIIIGEDLGTVTDEIRDMLSRFGILSYRLFYFEKHRDGRFKRIQEYPAQALVSSSTHDLPTLCGFWTGRDIDARRSAAVVDEAGHQSQWHDRQREKQHMLDVLHNEQLLPEWYSRSAEQVPEVDGELHNAIVGFLARVRSMLLLLNQEDLTKETEQQNLPGTTAQYPNWQRKMKASVEDLRSHEWSGYVTMFRDQLHTTQRMR